MIAIPQGGDFMRATLIIVVAMLFAVFLVSVAIAGDQTFSSMGLSNDLSVNTAPLNNPAVNVAPLNGKVEAQGPNVVLGTAPPVLNPVPQGAIDTRTGKFLPGVAGGVINPQDGTFYPDVGGGYVNSRTGELLPKLGR